MLKNTFIKTVWLTGLLFASISSAKVHTYITVEEARIDKATQANPKITQLFSKQLSLFQQSLNTSLTAAQLKKVINQHAASLWLNATEHLQSNTTFDDRPLYWARLQMAKAIRTNTQFRALSSDKQQSVMFKFELLSRGFHDIQFDKTGTKKILVTGFDPFFLDRNIGQSNPSGIAAMYLDNRVVELDGERAHIQAMMIPVRFADFDMGMIETMLSEYYPDVDMITTISMGRKDFDLERFPGLRRSAKAPGNLNVYTGASAKLPLKPFLHDKVLTTPEFVQFSLPVKYMQKATGPFEVIDNHNVETIKRGKFAAKSLAELKNATSVQGSGGGYLSNEISYRSIVLRNKLNPELPVGHIHTPRIKDWKFDEVKGIVLQIEDMLRQSIPAL